MKRTEQDRMLQGILEDESLVRIRRESLERGLTAVRRRRFRRRAALAGTMVSLAGLLSFLSLPHRQPPNAQRVLETSTKVAGVKFINDQELLALFPERSLALIGAPGNQQLVFLDLPTPPAAVTRDRQ